jgi:hypothetical protein
MRSLSCIPVVLFATIAAVACAQPRSVRGPAAIPGYASAVLVEVQNNSTMTVNLLCRRGSGRVARLGRLATGHVRRYELPPGCGRVSAQTLSGRSAIGVVVRYLEAEPRRPLGPSQRA